MTSTRAGMRAAALVSVLSILSLYPCMSRSGDEVDYSAPYLVVENGELVTRYPAKKHAPGETSAADATPAGSDEAGTPSWLVPAVLVAAIACVGGLLVARLRK